MITITDFKSKVKNLARPNRFYVDISVPEKIGQFKEEFRYLIQDAAIPDRGLPAILVKYHGQRMDIPGDYSHEDLTIKFLNDSKWEIRKFFEKWITVFQTLDAGNLRADCIDVLDNSVITVTQIGLDEEDILAQYYYRDVYPKTISNIQLGMENENTNETFDVTFGYSSATRL